MNRANKSIAIGFLWSLIWCLVVMVSSTANADSRDLPNWSSDNIVKFDVNGTVYEFNRPPFWVEVIAPVARLQPWHWPATQVFYQDSPKIQAKHQSLEQLLSNTPDTQSLNDLIATVDVGERIYPPGQQWDFDRARIYPMHNPQFFSGPSAYLVTLKLRPTTITVLGAVKQTSRVTIGVNMTASDYVKQVQLSDNADADKVWVIQPNGVTFATQIGPHNNDFQTVMPGSLIYVPFDTSPLAQLFTTDYEAINVLVVDVLPHAISMWR